MHLLSSAWSLTWTRGKFVSDFIPDFLAVALAMLPAGGQCDAWEMRLESDFRV